MLKLRPQPLTDASFAPFGRLIHVTPQTPPDFGTDAGTRGWQVPIQMDDPLYMVLFTPASGATITQLECHSNVAQTFIPLGGGPAALAVARPTVGNDQPGPADVRLFLLDGSAGYILHQGTWHAPDRVPLSGQGTRWMMVTERATQADLPRLATGNARHTRVFSLPEAWGGAMEVDAPAMRE